MHNIGFWGFSVASLVYLVFALLIFAARNNAFIARWLLVCALVSSIAHFSAALQIQMSFGLKWAMLLDAINIGCWSLLILSFNGEVGSISELLKRDSVKRYVSVWLGLVLGYWLGSELINSPTNYLF